MYGMFCTEILVTQNETIFFFFLASGELSVSKLSFLQSRHDKRKSASLVTNGPRGISS